MSEDTPRILYITTFYPTKERPHHGIFFKDHAVALAQKYSVAVLFCASPSIKEKWIKGLKSNSYLENKVYTQVEYNAVLSHRNEKDVAKKLEKSVFNGFEKLIKSWGKPDYIIAQCSSPAGELASLLKQHYSINFGLIEHYTFLKEQLTLNPSKYSSIYSTADFIGCVDISMFEFIKEMVPDLDTKKLISFLNVISQSFKLVHRPKLETEIKWLFIGYDVPKKGPDILLNVLKMYPEMHLTVIGAGLSYFEHAEFKHVKHIESASREEMVQLMSEHHALVSTSRIETFGMAIVEALATGMPVVATKSSGPDHYLTSEMGILCEQDAKSVLQSVQELENNYDKYDSLQISTSILSKFGAQNYINQIEKILSLNVE